MKSGNGEAPRESDVFFGKLAMELSLQMNVGIEEALQLQTCVLFACVKWKVFSIL